MNDDATTDYRTLDRAGQVAAVVADVRRRRDAGEEAPDELVMRRHPELMPELREELNKLNGTVNVGADPMATTTHGGSKPGKTFEVRCPNCRSSIDVPADASLASIACSSCGSQFDLVNDAKATWAAPSFTQLGRFELIEKLGVGSFGAVWKARDRELDRTVAIKTPRQGAMTAADTEKFFREARAAAQLRHPNIVSVHEVGRDGDSVYIVSDFVRGVTLGDWLTGQKLTSREAAELTAKIADALEHAHQQGVVHRDLKPANIMIDGDGEPHLMDFGLARRELGEMTMTVDGQVLGTPAYMSPEQAVGQSHLADRRSDVYSLGVILFELLTGELPFRGNSRMLIHQVINEEPPSPRKFNASVPRDLETIALKCVEKKPEKRFSTSGDLAAELRRHLVGEPILSRPITRVAKAWRWAKRKPMVAGLSAAVAALLCIVAAAGPVIAVREAALRQTAERGEEAAIALRKAAEESEQRARQNEEDAKKSAEAHLLARHDAQLAQVSAEREKEQAERAREQLAIAQQASERTVYARTISLAQQEWENANISQCEDLLDATRSDLRGWEWEYLKHLCHTELITLRGLRSAADRVCLHKDGVHAACNSRAELTVLVWNRLTGQVRARHSIDGLAFNRDGTRLAGVAMGGGGKAIRALAGLLGGNIDTLTVFDALTGEKMADLAGHKNGPIHADFSADGTKLATTGRDKAVRVWDATTGRQIVEIDEPDPQAMYFIARSADGSRVSWRRSGGLIVVHDAANGEKVCEIHDPVNGIGANAIEFSPDATLLAAASRDQISIWQVDGGQRRQKIHGHRGIVIDLAWAPEGDLLASCGYDGTARLWDTQSGRELLRLRGHKAGGSYGVHSVAYSSDGRRLITGGADMMVKVWDARAGDPLPEEFDSPAAPGVAASSFVWQLTPDLRQDVDWIYGHAGYVLDMGFTPDGNHVVTCSQDKTVNIVDAATKRLVRSFTGHGESVAAVCVSPDGKSIASGSGGFYDTEAGTILIWSPETGEVLKTLKGHAYPISQLRYAAIGERLISASGTQGRPQLGELIVWDAASGALLRKVSGIEAAVTGLDVSPDGRVIVTCGYDGRVRLWDLDSGELLRDVGQGSEVFGAVAFSADGRTIAAGGRQWSVTLFDVESGSTIWKRFEHSGAVTGVSFANERRLLSCGVDGTARMWDVESGECLLAFRDSASDLYRAQLSPDGRTLVCCGAEPRLSLRRVPFPSEGAPGEWQVLLADDFEDGDLNANWTVVNGKWTIEDGAARGVFSPEKEDAYNFAATLEAKAPMPSNVEVMMDMWAPQEIGYEIKLHNTNASQSLVALVIGKVGLRFNRGERGYSIITQAGAGNWQESSSRRGEFEPSRKYKVRGVRSGGRWRMYVDDQLVLESDAAEDLTLPELRLQGSHGKRGDVVYLDNIEVRTPSMVVGDERDWPVIFEDDFESGELADRWRTVNGDWTIDQGAARGTFGPEEGGTQIYAATLEAFPLMPSAVEISYDAWSPHAIVVETVLRDAPGSASLIGAHIGRTGGWSNRGEKGFAAIVQAGVGNYQEVARRRYDFTFEADRKYHLRAIRHQGRWRMFFDETMVLESDASERSFLPLLRLHGVHGEQGDVVFIDNVKVRSPMPEGLSAIVKDRAAEEALRLAIRQSRQSAAGVAEAIAWLRELPDDVPASALDQLVMSELLMLGGASDRAISLSKSAVDQGDKRPFYFMSHGMTLWMSKERKRAAEEFEKALGRTKLEAADVDQWTAAYFLDRASEVEFVKRASRETGVTEAYAWYYIGRRKQSDGLNADAIEAYQKSIDAGRKHGVRRPFVHQAAYCLARLR